MDQINVPTLRGFLPGESDNDNKYRYYHCIMNSSGSYTCEKRESPSLPENNKVSQLVPIHKLIPEVFDPLVIKNKLIPKIHMKK
jgi:hypothetical protein